MATRVLLALLVLAAAQAPGNPDHKEPPAGWFCSHNDPRPAHQCSCHRVDDDPICEGVPHEQAICKSYCFASHCHCPVACEPTHS